MSNQYNIDKKTVTSRKGNTVKLLCSRTLSHKRNQLHILFSQNFFRNVQYLACICPGKALWLYTVRGTLTRSYLIQLHICNPLVRPLLLR